MVNITIQSYGRPENVENMMKALDGLHAVWYVPESQATDYIATGAEVYGVEEKQYPMKTLQQNAALENGFRNGKNVITMDDDFEKAIRVRKCENNETIVEQEEVNLRHLIETLDSAMSTTPFKLGGYHSNHNPFWCHNNPKYYGMLTGQILYHKQIGRAHV